MLKKWSMISLISFTYLILRNSTFDFLSIAPFTLQCTKAVPPPYPAACSFICLSVPRYLPLIGWSNTTPVQSGPLIQVDAWLLSRPSPICLCLGAPSLTEKPAWEVRARRGPLLWWSLFATLHRRPGDNRAMSDMIAGDSCQRVFCCCQWKSIRCLWTCCTALCWDTVRKTLTPTLLQPWC